jgi:putative nucleotidyltransferase-like protein
MNNVSPKQAVVSALSHDPDFSGLAVLPSLNTQAGRALSEWMDQSGLALPFLKQLRDCDVSLQIRQEWRHSLSQRQARNVARTEELLDEAQRINCAFRSFHVNAATLKGFTLVPDFCDDPVVRHQVDFDFLVAPGSVQQAAEALRACGYFTAQLNESGETCFLTPSQHIPSASDDLYALQPQRQVDVHTSIWESCSWFPLEVPRDCLERAQAQTIHGVKQLSLALEDKLLLQVLHLFRHAFRSWIRVSWLLELAKCMDKHLQNEALWDGMISRAGHGRLTKSIFAFVLGLVARLFQTPIPAKLNTWTTGATTPAMCAWLDHFGCDWALSDWPGSLNNLFLAAEFIPDPSLRLRYWRSRLIPRRAQASLGSIAPATPQMFFQLQAARVRYLAHRAAVHFKDIAALPRQQLRWKRALESSRRRGLGANC